MDVFKQNKILKIGLGILVILNFALMAFMFWKTSGFYSNKNDRPEELAKILKEKLDLSEEQAIKIEEIRQNFFNKEKKIVAVIRSKRDSMNEAMFNKDLDTVLVKRLALSVASAEHEMELSRLQQAQEFKKICTPTQQEKFQDLVHEIKNYFKPIKKQKQK